MTAGRQHPVRTLQQGGASAPILEEHVRPPVDDHGVRATGEGREHVVLALAKPFGIAQSVLTGGHEGGVGLEAIIIEPEGQQPLDLATGAC